MTSISVFDTAKYITEQIGEVSSMKLQKLMYYSQAWNLVWEEDALFDEEFQAWANGPVLPNLYARHKGQFKVTNSLFSADNSENLTLSQKQNIDKVLSFYGNKTAQWLSDLTHQESPWLDARGETTPGERSENIITKAAIHEYYSSI
jgi:uncharacterized phage-associated protein